MFNTKIKFRIFVCASLALFLIILFPSSSNPSTITLAEDKKPTQTNIQKTESKPAYEDSGKATYYKGLPGKKLKLTAAHKFLKKGTIVRVEAVNRKDYAPVEVEINDTLPNIPANKDIIIDLSIDAALAMSPKFKRAGKIDVRVVSVDRQ